MVVVLLYFHKLNPFSFKKTIEEKKATVEIWFKVIVGVIPAAVTGLLFDDCLNEHLYNYWTVAIMLIFYGILFTGMIVAFIVSIFAIRFLLVYIKNNNFKIFGWYRIILGIVVIGYFLIIRINYTIGLVNKQNEIT